LSCGNAEYWFLNVAQYVRTYPTGENMKYILLAVVLLLNACDNSSTVPKIAAPQREALEKAKGVDQAVQKETEESKKKIEDAEK
jgi:hypothetical protein